jgi:hypothetical protein
MLPVAWGHEQWQIVARAAPKFTRYSFMPQLMDGVPDAEMRVTPTRQNTTVESMPFSSNLALGGGLLNIERRAAHFSLVLI